MAKRPPEPLHQDPSQSHYSGYTGLFDSSPACQTRLTLGPFYLSFALYLECSSPRSLHGLILHTICVQDIITCHFWGRLPGPWYLTKSAFLSPTSHSLSSYPVLFHLFVCYYLPISQPQIRLYAHKEFFWVNFWTVNLRIPKAQSDQAYSKNSINTWWIESKSSEKFKKMILIWLIYNTKPYGACTTCTIQQRIWRKKNMWWETATGVKEQRYPRFFYIPIPSSETGLPVTALTNQVYLFRALPLGGMAASTSVSWSPAVM